MRWNETNIESCMQPEFCDLRPHKIFTTLRSSFTNIFPLETWSTSWWLMNRQVSHRIFIWHWSEFAWTMFLIKQIIFCDKHGNSFCAFTEWPFWWISLLFTLCTVENGLDASSCKKFLTNDAIDVDVEALTHIYGTWNKQPQNAKYSQS